MSPGLPATVLRVVRGGAWNNPSRNLRAAIRNRNRARNRNRNLGFRVVFRSGPEHAPHRVWNRAGEVQDRPAFAGRPKQRCPAVPVSLAAHRPAGLFPAPDKPAAHRASPLSGHRSRRAA